MFSSPKRKQHKKYVSTDKCWAKASFIDFNNPLTTNLYENTNMPCNSTITGTRRQQNTLFNCFMLIPVSCIGYIIGRKGRTIQEICRNCQVHINIDTKFILKPRREFRTTISGKILNCKKAIKQILQLIRQVNYYKNYSLKLYLNAFYLPHLIGKKGKFIKNIKFSSKANLVKVFPTCPNTKSNGVLVINHTNINICIKAATIAMYKVLAIQNFQIGKAQPKSKLSLSNKKISQTFDCMNTTVIHNNQEPVSEGPPCLHINTINEKEVPKAAEIKKIALTKQTIVENTTENTAVEAEKQCDKLKLSNFTSNTIENNIKTASLPIISDDTKTSHLLEANLAKKLGHLIFFSIMFFLEILYLLR